MMNKTLADIDGPTDADLATVEVPSDTDLDGWEALLDPVVTITAQAAEDFWNVDENVHDDRYDGDDFPVWSAWR